VLPFIGVILVVTAASSTGLVGAKGNALLDALPAVAFVLLAARWLGQQVFAKSDDAALLPGLSSETRAEGRLNATLLGTSLALAGLLVAAIPQSGATLIARVVLAFPIIVVVGILLVRLGQILVGAARAETEGTEPTTRSRLLSLIGRGALLFGVAGPILAAIGYYSAGRFMVFPAAMSLALLAFVVILQQLTTDLYALVTGHGEDEEEDEALMPVLIGFALGLGALPVLALIWGARVSDLTELWARVREGFVFGETRIAPTDFLTFAIVFAIGYLATRLVQGAMRTSVLPKTRIDPGGQNALVSGLGYLGIFLATVVAVTSAGIDLSSLAIVAGALSVGIGFGLQNIVSNFISGIILLVERPISEGDWIEVNGQMGHVRDISVRSTRIETFDLTDVIVPNSDLISGIVTNYTRGNLSGRVILKVGVAYGTDTKVVDEILREVARNHPMVSLSPEPAIFFTGFGADSLDFEIRAILRDVHYSMVVRSEMNHEITRRFAEAGIEIPFAQRDIWLRNPEVLTGGKAAAAEKLAKAVAKPKAPRKPRGTPGAAAVPTIDDMPGSEDD
jgi:small-conductance mechanosensitive channel